MSTPQRLVAELRGHVADDRVLAAIAAVDRAAFVARRDRRRAWDNVALGIGCGQTISQPLVVARMCEVLRIAPGDRVLEVGTGSGYHAAVLAALGARVVSVERHAELSAAAAGRLPGTVELVVGDGRAGHAAGAPYDAITVAATAEAVPPPLLGQLADGGRLVAPLRDGDEERLVLLTRRGAVLAREDLEPVRFVPLV